MVLAAAFAVSVNNHLGDGDIRRHVQATRQGRVGDIVLHLGASLSLLGLATWCLIKGTGVAVYGSRRVSGRPRSIALLRRTPAGARRLNLLGIGFVAWAHVPRTTIHRGHWSLTWVWVGIICLLARSDPRTREGAGWHFSRWQHSCSGVYTGFGNVNWMRWR